MDKRSVFCSLLFLSLYVSAQIRHTTIKGINVGFSYSSDIFPEAWRPAPISASGKQISSAEVQRSKLIMVKALGKYPGVILKYNLKGVYFLKEMKFYGVGFGGTNSADAVYLTNEGASAGYSSKYLEQTFHHEFSSILLRNYPYFLDTNAWKDANQSDFIYNDPENGVGAIRNNQSSQSLDSLLCEKGVLTQYGGSSLENDVNTFAQNLFCPEKNFWLYVNRFSRIRKKVNLLIGFYNKLGSAYTEQYFRRMETR
jgi:hypothetical protein